MPKNLRHRAEGVVGWFDIVYTLQKKVFGDGGCCLLKFMLIKINGIHQIASIFVFFNIIDIIYTSKEDINLHLIFDQSFFYIIFLFSIIGTILYMFKKEEQKTQKGLQNKPCETMKTSKAHTTRKIASDVGKGAAIAATIGVAIPVAVTATVQAVGFGAAGVIACSAAVGIQATMGGIIAKGSAFAICQSIGATGFAATIGSMFLPVALIGLGIAVVYSIYKWWKASKESKRLSNKY